MELATYIVTVLAGIAAAHAVLYSRAKDDRLYTPTSGYHGDPEEDA